MYAYHIVVNITRAMNLLYIIPPSLQLYVSIPCDSGLFDPLLDVRILDKTHHAPLTEAEDGPDRLPRKTVT